MAIMPPFVVEPRVAADVDCPPYWNLGLGTPIRPRRSELAVAPTSGFGAPAGRPMRQAPSLRFLQKLLDARFELAA